VTAIPTVVLIAGFVLGLVFGSIALLSGFCVTSALRNWWTEGDGRLIRTLTLALAVAIVGTQMLAAGGLVDLGQSIYLAPSFSAALILCGGLLFGYGMVAANGCVSRALILLGRGNLRSLVVVATVAVSAEVTLKGLLAPVRLALLQWSQNTVKIRSLPDLLAAHGLAAAPVRLVAAAAVAGVLSVFVIAHAPFRRATVGGLSGAKPIIPCANLTGRAPSFAAFIVITVPAARLAFAVRSSSNGRDNPHGAFRRSCGTSDSVSRSVPRSTSSAIVRAILSPESARTRSSAPVMCAPSRPMMMSPWRKPARAAGLSASTVPAVTARS
jgi:uncharacterized membrane protein YedE/YeeE